MDLKKCAIKGKSEFTFYCKKDEVVNDTNYVLIGFKDNLPVLSKTMSITNNPDLNSKKTLKVEVNSQTGEKFINLNGRKLKMVTELPPHLRQNSQILKTNPTNGIVGKPVQIKIIGTMPSIFCGSTKLIKTPESQDRHKFVFKPHVNRADNASDNTKLSQKTILIKENKLSTVKNPSIGKVVAVSTTTGSCADEEQQNVKFQNVTELKCEVNKFLTSEIKTFKIYQSAHNMKALDLTKLSSQNSCSNLSRVDIKNTDKCVQTDNKSFVTKCVTKSFVTKCVQTEETFPPSSQGSRNLIDLDSFDLVEYINSTLKLPETTEPIEKLNYSTDIPEVHSTTMKAPQSNKIQLMFFNDLRLALQPDDKGNMPIHVGVLSNNINLIKRNCAVLKALQKSVDLPNHGDLTALQLAVLNDASPEIVKTLLLCGASLEITDSEGNNVLHLAVENERKVILEIILKAAMQRKFNLDHFNAEGLTPLMICCSNGLHQCAEILLEHQADINIKDRKSGRTALFHAAENHDLNMVQLLLSYNADTKIKNFFGTSPHDAMYEVEEIPEDIKSAILGKCAKRKLPEEPRVVKVKRKDEAKKPLKTYARYKKIDDFEFPKNFTTIAK